MPRLRRVSTIFVTLAYLPKKFAFRSLLAAADRARDGGQIRKAAVLYRRATRLFPFDASLKVQLGNMLKDTARFEGARRSYEAARSLRPDDADLLLQLGHLSKLQGRLQEASDFYRRSAALDPRRPDAAAELARIGTVSWLDDWVTQLAVSGTGTPQASARPLLFLCADSNRLVLERLMVSFENRAR